MAKYKFDFQDLIAILIVCVSLFVFFTVPLPGTITEIEYLNRSSNVSASVVRRMLGNIVFQSSYNPRANLSVNALQDQFILLTGGNIGIGYETAKGLVANGAHVIIASRNVTIGENAVKAINNDAGSTGKAEFMKLDLSDLNDVIRLVKDIKSKYPDKRFNQLIENSAIYPNSYSETKQGYEVAFGVNALAHHLLFRKLIKDKMLESNARVIMLTGDIYFTASDCTPDFKYTNKSDEGTMAYSRSKICVNWLFKELHDRYKEYEFYLVHPAVASTELAGPLNMAKNALLIDARQAAQTTLICASHKSKLLKKGSYYHNTYGRVVLPPEDTMNDRNRSKVIYEVVEKIVSPYLTSSDNILKLAPRVHEVKHHMSNIKTKITDGFKKVGDFFKRIAGKPKQLVVVPTN